MYPTNIQPGAPVVAADGEVGRVTHVVVEPGTRDLSELVVDRDGQEWIIPISLVEGTSGDAVLLRGSRDRVLTTRFDRERFRAAEQTNAGDEGAAPALHGSGPLQRTEGVALGGGDVVPPPSGPEQVLGRDAGERDRSKSAAGDTIRIPLRREEITIEKRWVVAEEVAIFRHPVPDTERMTDTVRHERAVIERRGDVEVRRDETSQ